MYHTGPWTLADLREGKVGLPKNGLRVFSCFSGGGGSSMGYRLAGYHVVGFCEIDDKMANTYLTNMKVDRPFRGPVSQLTEFIGDKLSDLDVLDGSPPCSSFSMAGNREKDWGKKKKFTEGQAVQVLDDLFFDFIEVAKQLRPKVIVAENVKGLILGRAKEYVAEIFLRMRDAGYEPQLFLLNASRMGVPQRRERTFFIARRSDLGLPAIRLSFDEDPIPVSKAFEGITGPDDWAKTSDKARTLWARTMPGDSFAKAAGGSWFQWSRLRPDRPSGTLTAQRDGGNIFHWSEPRRLRSSEFVALQSFPTDYDFADTTAEYVCGMSVPPLMMQRVAGEVARQVFQIGTMNK